MKTELDKTRIDWCDHTWNPVWGCLNDCEYCYARNIAKRFGEGVCGQTDFKPVWIQNNFNKKLPKNPSKIFVNSMSDIAYWHTDWMFEVVEKINAYNEHKYLFLTKTPEVYFNIELQDHCWRGVTVTNQETFENFQRFGGFFNNFFVSIEPLQGYINLRKIIDLKHGFKWIILGAESGTRKNKIKPDPSWIEEIIITCVNNNIPIFMKDNLKPYYSGQFLKQFPEGLK